MVNIRALIRGNGRLLFGAALAALFLVWLLAYRLGTLVGGLSASEVHAAVQPVGWHGIFHDPLFLPLKLLRSVIFDLWPNHGQILTRLPNAIMGALAILTFTALIRIWHSERISLFAGLMFACSAWVLHVSRLATFDVVYLWALPLLLLIYALSSRHAKNQLVSYGSLLALGLLLYVPGLVWFMAITLFFMRKQLVETWKNLQSWWKRSLYVSLTLLPLPLLVIDLLRHNELIRWLGLPAHLDGITLTLKHFLQVPGHLFIRGPAYPMVWLSGTPLLDIFSLVACVIGIYFYVTHLKAVRSRLLLAYAMIGWILIAISGPVSLSLLVPLLYVGVASGIAYLLHEWLKVFPLNPFGRTLGLGLISLAIALSCLYNLRVYFVAWTYNPTTKTIFLYHR